jgi:hypothetical protein
MVSTSGGEPPVAEDRMTIASTFKLKDYSTAISGELT